VINDDLFNLVRNFLVRVAIREFGKESEKNLYKLLIEICTVYFV